MSILNQIVKDKKKEIANKLIGIRKDQLKKSEADHRIPLDFIKSLKDESLAIIAEIKKASPSKGVIRQDFDPLQIAKSYSRSGANCLSVLTEEMYFQGHPDYLKAIRQEVDIPLLRKDFIVDERQIRESYDLGADAILLIVSILSEKQLADFKKSAAAFGLTTLVEVHTKKELDVALKLNCHLIGINNRNLATFETDIQQSINLKKLIPSHVTCVSESGIHSTADCRILHENGFDAVLVGETLMRQPDPGAYIATLLGKMS
ncbi:MAG: indole-3-glycerol phosphate synthase TrpC [Deltaproteobacteria bacterium]|jgi:indole-3-glycerol phosphate synthase|nr:indole-3-glycerol phosphate synthase TrpC [Deltaproteobacteria bacterium]MBT4264868.1 indole-3-glycerol phosphate synthase TrpC [Deltaproteobacteria bacterium]MBT4640046.1 indole-3-glycerol phosphate synthase TrpC [Deltaproteobacteria bacterium]MBT6610507.1 indole-3-glycerol phosphate synthase TrpC [Deltaproteobacteria bacterium]MBT7153181.1 indole-3-glycerol phosphate synthase TrpC [Deltaproteobacteria bacterium]